MKTITITYINNKQEQHYITYLKVIEKEIIFKNENNLLFFIDLEKVKKIFIE